ncbi:MAG: hypothetical protein M3440_08450 [Chloroflexota bacterium]|nr:hypothetical protein [Chloroflexota bacterium]
MNDTLPSHDTGTLAINGWGYVLATIDGATHRYPGHITTQRLDDQSMICVQVVDGDDIIEHHIIAPRNVEAVELLDEQTIRSHYQRRREHSQIMAGFYQSPE